MAEGMTCYERDEVFCEDQMCLRVGCRLQNERLSAESKMPARIWTPSESAPYSTPYIRADLVEPLVEALRVAIRVADEAREEWDKAPSGMKAGKLLIALSDPDMKYRADITAIHTALSTYAAAVGSKEATP